MSTDPDLTARYEHALPLVEAYRPYFQQAIDESWTVEQFAAGLGVPIRRTRWDRIRGWWRRNRPVLHRGDCDHTACY